MPTIQNRIIPLEVGEEYVLCFYTSKGLYKCKARIKSRGKEQNIFILILEFLTTLEKHQRRKFYRLACTSAIKARQFTKEEEIYVRKIINNDFINEDDKENCKSKLEE